MNIGKAIQALKNGRKVGRTEWNGKNMYLYLMFYLRSGSPSPFGLEPCICIVTAQGKHQPGWLASQADLLAEDWEVLD